MSLRYFFQIGWEFVVSVWNALLYWMMVPEITSTSLSETENEEDPEDFIKRIVKVGKEISSCYSKRNGCPVMLPPAAEYYQDKNVKQQLEHEGEQKVYKALETLRENFIALLGLRFTHQQYNLFVGYDGVSSGQSDGGGIDFLVIHDKCVLILNVISYNGDSNNMFMKHYAASKNNLEKVYKFVIGINKKFKFIEAPTLHQFTVFMNITKSYAEDSLVGYVSLSPEEKHSILFGDDLENQEALLFRLLGKTTLRITIENKVKWFLLGLWKTNKNIKTYAKITSGLSQNIERFEDLQKPLELKGGPANLSDDSSKDRIQLMKPELNANEGLIKRIVKVGIAITSLHCKEKNGHPIMFPPAPLCKFIDKYPDNITDEPNWVKQIEKRQREYEAEVTVYRTLEEIREDTIVLHGVHFSHQQYNLFVKHDCNKKDMDDEGEIDFIMIHDRSISIIEVKASDCDNETKFKRNYMKSKDQREKVFELLMGVSRKYGFKSQAINQFTVFTSINRQYAEDNLVGYRSLSSQEKYSILFKDDLENKDVLLSCLFQETTPRKKTENKMKCLLLGLWCVDKNNESNFTKTCDFGKNIERVDDLLRTSEITSSSKRGNRSPLVKNAPPIFTKHLKIKCLTASQLDVFESKQNKLCIRGPAGTGKTILIMAKVMEIVKSTNKTVAIIVLNKTLAKKYSKAFAQSGLKATLWGDEKYKSLKLKGRVLIKYFVNQVTVTVEDLKILPIVEVNEKDRCSSLTTLLRSDYDIFIDDFHGLTTGVGDKADRVFDQVLAEFKSKSRSKRTFWIANDTLQRGYINDYTKKHKKVEEFISRLSPDVIKQLSDNLRNCYEIAQFLAEIRKMRSKSFDKGVKFIDQQPGHFIHGPKGILLLLKSFTLNTKLTRIHAKKQILKELEKLKNTKVAIIVNDDRLLASDKGFEPQDTLYTSKLEHFQRSLNFHQSDIIDWEELCKDTVNEFLAEAKSTSYSGTKNPIDIIQYENTFSAEWPAVIGILEWTLPNCCNRNFTSEFSIEDLLAEWYDQQLTRMYITASRARVYCSLIIVLRDVESFVKEGTLVNSQYNCGSMYSNSLTAVPVLEITKQKILLLFNDIFRIFGSYMLPTVVIMRHGSPLPYSHKQSQCSPSDMFADYENFNKQDLWEHVDINDLINNPPAGYIQKD